MIIGLCGPSGSGKTTTARMLYSTLKERGYNVGIVNEVVRDVFPRFGFKDLTAIRNSDKYYEFEVAIMIEQMERESKAAKQYDIVICDRTVFDIFLYVVLYGDLETIIDFVDEFAGNLWYHSYDKVFLFEPIPGNVDDGFRTPDINNRDMQLFLLNRWLREMCYTYVPYMSVEDRVKFILKEVQL